MKYIVPIVLTSLILTACSTNTKPPEPIVETKTIYLTVPLQLPEKMEIPRVSAKEMSCLSDSTKNTLIKRDTIMKKYILDLETVIEANNNKAK